MITVKKYVKYLYTTYFYNSPKLYDVLSKIMIQREIFARKDYF